MHNNLFHKAISAEFPRRVACKIDELIYLLRCDVFFLAGEALFSNSKVRYRLNSSLTIFHSPPSYSSKSLDGIFLRAMIKQRRPYFYLDQPVQS